MIQSNWHPVTSRHFFAHNIPFESSYFWASRHVPHLTHYESQKKKTRRKSVWTSLYHAISLFLIYSIATKFSKIHEHPDPTTINDHQRRSTTAAPCTISRSRWELRSRIHSQSLWWPLTTTHFSFLNGTQWVERWTMNMRNVPSGNLT